MDTQVIELLGRNWLVSQLLSAGLEVAMPVRDRGIDLIAFIDKNKFVSCPIQMKAATQKAFSLNKKYEKFPNMLLTYVWNLDDINNAVSYALTFKEAFKICDALGWTKTPSWRDGGSYSTSAPSKKLLKLLEPYLMSPKKWHSKVVRIIG
jgi:hypothetical protein